MADARKERFLRSLDLRRREYPEGHVVITDDAISLVFRALADHTQIMDAINYAQPQGDNEPWPEATSVGRWMHHMADQFDPRFRPDKADS